MARLIVAFRPHVTGTRAKLRRDWQGRVRKKDRKKIREEMARALEREGRNRLFRELATKSKLRRKAISQRLFEARLAAVKEMDPKLDDADARAEADRTTLLKISSAKVRRERAFFVQVRRGGKLINAYRRGVVLVKGRRRIRVGAGPLLKASTVRRSLAAQAHWARVKALAKAAQISVGEARRLDKVMIDLPDSVRRRIYAQIVAKLG